MPLALAAGLIGLLAIWEGTNGSARGESAVPGASEMMTAVMAGTSAAAARAYARSLTNALDITDGAIE